MQTFMAYPDFTMSAKVLDRQRLGKQRVEALQILHTNWQVNNKLSNAVVKSIPWENHPAVLMWRNYSTGLYLYLKEICKEWVSRGYKDTCLEKALAYVIRPDNILLPNWIGSETFHSSHRAALLFKNPIWYQKFGWEENPCINYLWPKPIFCEK